MESIVENIDNDEQDTDDNDLCPSSYSPDWKLNSNVECRAMLERMESFDSKKEVQRDSDETDESKIETSSGQNESVDVDKSCDIYRKLKLLVDDLKTCDKTENCGLCEKYIQQLQQHLLLTHGNTKGDAQENNSMETVPIIFDRHDVSSDEKNSCGDVAVNSEDELVSSLANRSDIHGEPISRKKDAKSTNGKSTQKVRKSKPFKCVICRKGFLCFYDLTQHKTTHSADLRDTGNVSGKFCQTSSDENQNGASTGRQKHRFSCDVCQKVFSYSSSFIKHKMVHMEVKSYKCDVCGKCFVRNDSLIQHKKTHSGGKPHKCNLCGKCFTHNSVLTRHKFLHTGDKPYKCELCGKHFAENGSLLKHMVTHTGEKPYKCELCGKCFVRKDILTQHEKTHSGEKPHKCDLCGKRFTHKSGLTRHKFFHTGEKPYKCELCGKHFAENGNLLTHVATHTGEKPYKCEVCGKYFAKNDTLTKHMRTHTGEKPCTESVSSLD